MPQSPLNLPALNQSGAAVALTVDAQGNLQIDRAPQNTRLNITAATVVKGTAGEVGTLIVLTAGSTVGSVNDCATTGAVAAANAIMTVPNTVGIYPISFQFAAGLTVTPGTGQVLAVAYN